ncbi:hypothetical protein BDW22DRAFT_58312 [Trametopsis cervina]|nr:hypothetical protein BDW22DRAFT_58312 [Trametopsis cervina]
MRVISQRNPVLMCATNLSAVLGTVGDVCLIRWTGFACCVVWNAKFVCCYVGVCICAATIFKGECNNLRYLNKSTLRAVDTATQSLGSRISATRLHAQVNQPLSADTS